MPNTKKPKQATFELKKQDLFEGEFKTLIVPRHETGSIHGTFMTGLSREEKDAIKRTERSILGHLEKINNQAENGSSGEPSKTDYDNQRVIHLATSVADNGGTPDAIYELGQKIGSININKSRSKTIGCPLLGTGAGKIDHEIAYVKLIKGFLSVENSTVNLIICVPDEKIFKKVNDVNLADYNRLGNYVGNPYAQEMESDRPIDSEEEDKLDFKTFANALAGVIDSPETQTPLTLVVNAPWGAGKSSLGNLIREKLGKWPIESNIKHKTLWFNAWSHDDADNLKSAFTAFVAREINQYRNVWNRLVNPVPARFTAPSDGRKRRLRSIVLFGLTVAVIFGILYSLNQWLHIARDFFDFIHVDDKTVQKAVEGGATLGISFMLRFALQAASGLRSFLSSPKAEASAGKIPQLRAEIHRLIDQAIPKSKDARLVIFVDDLERCHETGPVDLLEVINQLLDHPKVVVVILADILAVAASADIKYEEIAKRYNPNDVKTGKREKAEDGAYGRLYIQKMIQLQFDLPIYQKEEMDDLITLSDQNETSDENHSSDIRENQEVMSNHSLKRIGDLFLATLSVDYSVFLKEIRDNKSHWIAKVIVVLFALGLIPIYLVNSLIKAVVRPFWADFHGLLKEKHTELRNAFYALTTLSALCFYYLYYLLAGYIPSEVRVLVSTQNSFVQELTKNREEQPANELIGILNNNFDDYMGLRSEYVAVQFDSAKYWEFQVSSLRNIFYDTTRVSKVKSDSLKPLVDMFLKNLQSMDRPLGAVLDLHRPNGRDATLNSDSSKAVTQYLGEAETIYENALDRFMKSYLRVIWQVKPISSQTWTLYGLGIAFILLFVTGVRLYVYQMQKQNLIRAKRGIENGIKSGKKLSEQDDTFGLELEKAQDLERKIAYERLSSSGELYNEALKTATSYLNLVLPRNAKRLSNKLRLLLNIAHEKKIVRNIGAHHMGKWVALQEAFPEFVTYISRNKDEMSEFEKLTEKLGSSVSDEDGNWLRLRAKLEAINPWFKSQKELVRILGEPEYRLSEKIDMLVYFHRSEEIKS